MPGKRGAKKGADGDAKEAAGGGGGADPGVSAPAKAPAKEITKEDVEAKEAEFNRMKDELQKRRDMLRAQIELKSSELQVARAKFQGAKDVQQALREDLKVAKSKKDAVLEGVKGHRAQMKRLISDMRSTTEGMRYRSVEAIDQRLGDIEDMERFGSMSAREETALLKERTDLKVQRMALESVSGKQKRLDALKARIDGESKAASGRLDSMREEMQGKFEKVEQQSKVVDGHRKAMDEIYQARKALEARRDEVRKQIDALYQENRAFKDKYHQAVRESQQAKWLERQAEREEQARKRAAEDERYRLQEKRRFEEDARRQAEYDPAAAKVAGVEALIDEIRQLAPDAARAHDEERGIKTVEAVPLALRKADSGASDGAAASPVPESAGKAKAVDRSGDAGVFGALAGAAGAGAGSKSKRDKAARKAARKAAKATAGGVSGGAGGAALVLPSVISLSEESRQQLDSLGVDPPMSTSVDDALPVLKKLADALDKVKSEPAESYASRFAKALGLRPGATMTTVFGPGKVRKVRESDGMLEVELKGFTATLYCTTEEASEMMSKIRYAERQKKRRAERESRGEGRPRGRGRGARADSGEAGGPRGRGRGRGRGRRTEGQEGGPQGAAGKRRAAAEGDSGASSGAGSGSSNGAPRGAARGPPPGLEADPAARAARSGAGVGAGAGAGADESKEPDADDGEAAAPESVTDAQRVRGGKVAGDASAAAFPTLGGAGGKGAAGAWAAGK